MKTARQSHALKQCDNQRHIPIPQPEPSTGFLEQVATELNGTMRHTGKVSRANKLLKSDRKSLGNSRCWVVEGNSGLFQAFLQLEQQLHTSPTTHDNTLFLHKLELPRHKVQRHLHKMTTTGKSTLPWSYKYVYIELISEKNANNLTVLRAIVMGLALIDCT